MPEPRYSVHQTVIHYDVAAEPGDAIQRVKILQILAGPRYEVEFVEPQEMLGMRRIVEENVLILEVKL